MTITSIVLSIAARNTPRPASPARRRPRLAVLAMGVLAVVLAAGCQTDNTPKAYNDLVRNAFTSTCTGDVPSVDGVTTTIASSGFCGCAYDVYVAMVPYDDDDKANRDGGATFKNYSGKTFLDINKELGEDANKFNDNSVVPQNVRDAINVCKTSPTTSGTTVENVGTAPPATAGPPPGTATSVPAAP